MTGAKTNLSLLTVISIAFCMLLVTNLLPIMRGGFGWSWTYELPRFLWLIPCGLMLTIYCIGTERILHGAPQRLLLWAFVWSVLIPIALLTLQGSPLYLLFSRTISPLTGGYLRGAVMTGDLGQTLRDLPDFLANYRKETGMVSGIALDPPGLLAAFRTVVSAFEKSPGLADTFGALLKPLQCQDPIVSLWTNAEYAAAWPQMFMPLWAGLTVVPLRRFGRLVFGVEAANKAVALWPLIPGIALFVPRLNTLYPLLTLTMLIFLWIGITRQKLIYVAIAGFILSVGTFLNLSLAPLGLLAGLLIFGVAIQKKSVGVQTFLVLATFGITVGSIWCIYYALSGISSLEIIGLGLGTHLNLDRPYLPWLFLHPWDMFMFIGLPIALIALSKGWQATRNEASSRLFLAALLITTIILILSGTARGETGRVWLFFSPLWLLVATNTRWQFAQISPIQTLCLIGIAAVLRVGFTALEPAAYPPDAGSPGFAYNNQFVDGNNKLTFVGLDTSQTSDAIMLTFHWRADTLINGRYEFSLIALRPDGSKLENINWIPEKRNYPPACWTPGRQFQDRVIIPTDGMKGDWTFSLQAWNSIQNTQMEIVGANQIGIGPIKVP